MKAAELRHRITIQERHEQRDAIGGLSSVWQDYADVWAAIWPVSGKELVQDMQLQASVTHRLRIRYLPGVTSKMQVVFGTRTFRIESVINWEERNVYMDLLCLEVVV